MSNSDEFKRGFAARAYPPGFLARYEIIECLASSQEGETLLVTKRGGNEYLIAKLSEEAQFDAECSLLGALSHPGLTTLREQITDGDTHILIRSFIEGKPLDKVIAERAMPESEIINIGAQLCDILTYLHTQSPPVIHRDVKPQNVILAPDGTVTLIDFGIARTYKPDTRKDTVFSGTSDFAPPEQYGFAQTDARADIYSLGVLLRFLLTGGDTGGSIKNPRLSRVVKRCTAFAPGARYASASAVKRALERADGRRAMKLVAVCVAVMTLCVGFVVGRYCLPYIPAAPVEAAVTFAEPVVERAVRLMLNRPEGDLTAQDLASVTELYIFQDRPVANINDFWPLLTAWYGSGMPPAQGGVERLDDMAMLPNLRTLCIAAQPLTDIAPLMACSALEYLEMRDVMISDVGALSGLPALRHVGLANTVVKDISPLEALENLTELDLTGWECAYSPVPLQRMGDFAVLSVYGCATAYQYLHDKQIGSLRLGKNLLEDMAPLAAITGLWNLDLSDSPIADLTSIERHEGLTTLNLARTNVTDLAPLLGLPNLMSLTLSDGMDASALSGRVGLTIAYQ